MTNEEGPENPSRSPSSLSSDGVDELNKPLISYKRNPRVLSSNEEVKSSENFAEDGENRIISSTSSFIKAAKDDKPEIVPFKKRSSFITYHNDNHPPRSQLTTRESGCKLSADEEHCVEKKIGDENLVVDDDISTKIHHDDNGGDNKTPGTTPQGGHDIAPTVIDDGKQAHDINIADTSVEKSDGNNEAEQVQEVEMKDVVDESKEDQKQVGYFVSLMMDDGDEVPDQLMELKDNGGDNGCLTTDHSKNGGNGDEDGQQDPMEDDGGHGNNISNNNTPGSGDEKSEGKKPMEIDIPVIIHEGASSKNSKLAEGGNGAEEEQVRPMDVVTKPEGGGEKGKEIANANRSTNDEQGEVGQQEEEDDDLGQKARKKLKISGSDEIIGSSNAVVLGPSGGIGRDEPQVRPPAVQQAASRTIRLFGFDINPCEQEHHVPIIIRNSGRSGSNQPTGGAAMGGAGATGDGSRPVMHRVVMLFGVDISGDQVQPAATGNGDGGSSNRQPGSDGGHGR